MVVQVAGKKERKLAAASDCAKIYMAVSNPTYFLLKDS